MPYYAHSLPDQPQEKWQPLETHLAQTADLAAEFATPFQSEEWARLAGWLHDLGKADSAFQGYLCRQNGLDDTDYDDGKVNHSSAGAAFAVENPGKSAGRILAYLVAGHHAGLPDWHSDTGGNGALSVRLDPEGKQNLDRIRPEVEAFLDGHLSLTPPPEFARKAENVHLWMRMLYSCLVDADFLNTEEFMDPAQAAQRSHYRSLTDLKPVFDRYMEGKTAQAPPTPVNVIRKDVLTACREAAQGPAGLYSLTVPTGGGKTLSGLAFALEHAVRHGKSRILYVIPYTSIIEQTAQVLSEIFGPENVVEHHSNLAPERETERSRLASENWDAPILVTTNVQFFESLYAARSSRCRKLHNLVNSVVILDEAQLLPPELLTPCVDVLNQLTRHYGVTVLLSTATQPALPGLDPAREIVPDKIRLYETLKRTEIRFPDSLKEGTDWETVAGELRQHEQVLCVVNTRRDCYDLFRLMPEGTIHLSALMCGEHRSRVIAKIKRHLKEGAPCRVISTQLVEAGVDLDFPVVYRALAGLDSIAQAAGRCNREGRLNAEGRLGEVRVFVPPKPAPRGLLRKGEGKTIELKAIRDLNIHDPDIFTQYFELFYSALNKTGKEPFLDSLVKNANPDLYLKFRSYAEQFKLIDDLAQRSVFVRFGDSARLLEQLRIVGPKREILRKLQRYTVNLSVGYVARFLEDGFLEEIRSGFLAQTDFSLYDSIQGLDIFRDTLPIEDLQV